MKYFLLILIIATTSTSCLRNLNVTEFFRKLEIKSPEYYQIINSNKSVYEKAIKEKVESMEDKEVEWITFWGESRYACGMVITEVDGEDYVAVPGEYKLKGETRSYNYIIYFIPDEKEVLTNSFMNHSW